MDTDKGDGKNGNDDTVDIQKMVDPALWQALGRARTQNCTKRSRMDLISWLASCTSVSERELQGLVAHTIEREHPGASKISQKVVLGLMRAVARLGLKTPFPILVSKLSDVFEACMLTSWASLKKDLEDWQAWWRIMRPVASLVLDGDKMEKCIAAGSEVKKEIVAIRQLCDSSILASRLFNNVLYDEGASCIRRCIEDAMHKHLKGEITNSVIRIVKQNALKSIASEDFGKDDLGDRIVELSFQGIMIRVLVKSVEQEIDLRVWAWMKERFPIDLVEPLPWEKGILDRIAAPEGLSWSEEVVGAARSARALVGLMTKKVAAETMIGYMEAQHDTIGEQDPFWILEQKQLEELGSEGGGQLVEKALLKCIPSSSTDLWSISVAMDKVAEVERSKLNKMAGGGGARKVGMLQEVLKAINTGGELDSDDWKDSDFMQQAKLQLPYLCQHTASSATAPTIVGMEALLAYYKEVMELAGGKPDNFAQLKPLQAFSWMLEAEHRNKLREWNIGLLASSSHAAKRKASGSGGSAKASKKEAAAASSSKDADADLMGLFG